MKGLSSTHVDTRGHVDAPARDELRLAQHIAAPPAPAGRLAGRRGVAGDAPEDTARRLEETLPRSFREGSWRERARRPERGRLHAVRRGAVFRVLSLDQRGRAAGGGLPRAERLSLGHEEPSSRGRSLGCHSRPLSRLLSRLDLG